MSCSVGHTWDRRALEYAPLRRHERLDPFGVIESESMCESTRRRLPEPSTALPPHYYRVERAQCEVTQEWAAEDRWSGRTVAEWMAARLGRPVSRYRGWISLHRLKPKPRHGVPRPRHALADPEEQATCKKSETAGARGGDRLPPGHGRAVGDGRTPYRLEAAAPPQLDAWRWLAGVVHPASGRTVFPLASAVSIDVFETIRGGARRLCSAGGGRAAQANRARARPSGLGRLGTPARRCACRSRCPGCFCRRTLPSSNPPSTSRSLGR